MKNTVTGLHPKVRIRYFPQIQGEDADMIFEFFMVYSRFEFALKQVGFRRVGNDEHVAPNWHAFSVDVQDRFNPDKTPELRQALDYYCTYPPKIQVLQNQSLAWKRNQQRVNESKFAWVIRSIGIVRNNLFHGGKFPWDQVRDTALLSYGLCILYDVLELDERVQSVFNSA